MGSEPREGIMVDRDFTFEGSFIDQPKVIFCIKHLSA
jgi:hypothetical protein